MIIIINFSLAIQLAQLVLLQPYVRLARQVTYLKTLHAFLNAASEIIMTNQENVWLVIKHVIFVPEHWHQIVQVVIQHNSELYPQLLAIVNQDIMIQEL